MESKTSRTASTPRNQHYKEPSERVGIRVGSKNMMGGYLHENPRQKFTVWCSVNFESKAILDFISLNQYSLDESG